jgi:hypothetical protein
MPRRRLLPGYLPKRHRRIGRRAELQLHPDRAELALRIVLRGDVEIEEFVLVGLGQSDVGISVPDVTP